MRFIMQLYWNKILYHEFFRNVKTQRYFLFYCFLKKFHMAVFYCITDNTFDGHIVTLNDILFMQRSILPV